MADITTRQGKGIALTFDEVDANFVNLNEELANVAQSVANTAQKGAIVNADIASNAAIADSKLATLTSAGKVANSATTASSNNNAGAIVTRDANGNFSAGTISAALSGNASTATRLQTPRAINGVTFDGSSDITINSSSTPQALTAGSFLTATGTFDGSVARTFAVDATSLNTANKVVARDAGGGFSAGSVSLSSLSVSGSSTLSGTLAVTGATTLGTATATTPATASNNTSVATTAYVRAQGYAPLASPALTGTPTVPTAAAGTNTTQAASTAFVATHVANNAPTKTGGGASGTWGIDISGNAASATKLATARAINGVPFDGTADITITTGATFAALSAGSYLTSSGVFDGSVARTFAVDAASASTPLKIVARDGSGNFAANEVSANLNGNANTATRLETPRRINGVSFDGTADITIQASTTAQALTAGSYLVATGTFNGSVARTFSVNATSANTADAIIARDTSGNFAAGTAYLAALSVSGVCILSGGVTIGGLNVTGTTNLGAATAATPATNSNSTAIATTAYVQAQGYAPSTSPIFTGTPVAPTPLSSDNSTAIATTAYVKAQGYATAASPTFTGTPVAPTPLSSDNSTAIATTAYVQAQGYAPAASPTFTGTPVAPTAAVNTSSTQVATTAFVVGQAGSTTPLPASFTPTVGTSLRYARADHVHPANDITFTATGGTSAGPTLVITQAGTSNSVVIPSASASASGIITTGTQTIAGAKTFTNRVEVSTTGDLFSGLASSSISDTNERFFLSGGGNAATLCSGAASVLNVFRSSGDGNLIRFAKAGSLVGTISVSGTTTTYATSSDYRLKENITPLTDALNRIKRIPVCRFNFLDSPSRTVDGFLAHEVQDVVPEAITGEKDGMEPVGNILNQDGAIVEAGVPEPARLKEGLQWVATGMAPVYQQIDHSKLVPLLTAAIQELLQRVETLEAQLT